MIVVVGSTQYKEMIDDHVKKLRDEGKEARIPAFDDHPGLNELEVCEYNRRLIQRADEVHIVWDQRSMGTIFDFGMAFALHKKIKIIYLEPKTFAGVMKRYEEKTF